jgi:hypothetical protein
MGELIAWPKGPTKSEAGSRPEFAFLDEPMPTDEEMLIMLEELGFSADNRSEQS